MVRSRHPVARDQRADVDERGDGPQPADSGQQGPFVGARQLGHIFRLEDGQEVTALRDVNLTIERGEFVAIIGANGSGKTTLAYHLNALLLPTSGEVSIGGLSTADPENRWDIRRQVGMVFQNPETQLVASTVEEDVAFGPENWGLPPSEIRARVDEALEIVGLQDYVRTPPHMLSGGEKQLVAIAGVLATQPACIVLDEPSSMLDPAGRRRVTETIRRLNTEKGLTILLITQSMEEAASARRVLTMHDGRIVMDGSPDQVYEQPQRLAALSLGLPAAAEIAHLLRRRGIRLPMSTRSPGSTLSTNPLSIAELAEALGTWRPSQGALC